MQHKLFITTVWLVLSSFSFGQNKYFEIYNDSALLKKDNNALIKEFERQMQKVNPAFSFKSLTTEIPAQFMPGQYSEKTNKIYLPLWQTSIPAMESFLTDVGGSRENAMKLANLFFYGYFLPHEVGHALQFNTKRVPENAYDMEYEANEIAITYWRSSGRGKEMDECHQWAKKMLSKLKNPVPPNTDAKKYITTHYWDLVKDPYQYGYIQFSQIVQIMEDPSLPDFNTYIKKYF